MADMNVNPQAMGVVVGMDMQPPYSVYVDGLEVAQHKSESEASALYNQLAGRTETSISASSRVLAA